MRHVFPRLIVHAAVLALSFCAAELAQAQACEPAQACGDVNDSGEVTSTDALIVLKDAVGQEVTLTCECAGGSGTCETELAQCATDLETCNAALDVCQALPVAGNGVIEAAEQCDTDNLDGYTLFCAAAPALAQACEPAQTCGDVNASGGVTSTDALLVLKGAVGQEVTLICECTGGNGTCESDLAQCTGDLATCNAALDACQASPHCGNGVVEAGEHCDTNNLDGATCQTLGHAGGTLACTDMCDFDVSGCNECTGVFEFDACWRLGDFHQSCNEVCAEGGDEYDPRTASIAGSGGTDANCELLLNGLDAPGTGAPSSGVCSSGGFGCVSSTNNKVVSRRRCTMPETDATSGNATVQRVCACL